MSVMDDVEFVANAVDPSELLRHNDRQVPNLMNIRLRTREVIALPMVMSFL